MEVGFGHSLIKGLSASASCFEQQKRDNRGQCHFQSLCDLYCKEYSCLASLPNLHTHAPTYKLHNESTSTGTTSVRMRALCQHLGLKQLQEELKIYSEHWHSPRSASRFIGQHHMRVDPLRKSKSEWNKRCHFPLSCLESHECSWLLQSADPPLFTNNGTKWDVTLKALWGASGELRLALKALVLGSELQLGLVCNIFGKRRVFENYLHVLLTDKWPAMQQKYIVQHYLVFAQPANNI